MPVRVLSPKNVYLNPCDLCLNPRWHCWINTAWTRHFLCSEIMLSSLTCEIEVDAFGRAGECSAADEVDELADWTSCLKTTRTIGVNLQPDQSMSTACNMLKFTSIYGLEIERAISCWPKTTKMWVTLKLFDGKETNGDCKLTAKYREYKRIIYIACSRQQLSLIVVLMQVGLSYYNLQKLCFHCHVHCTILV